MNCFCEFILTQDRLFRNFTEFNIFVKYVSLPSSAQNEHSSVWQSPLYEDDRSDVIVPSCVSEEDDEQDASISGPVKAFCRPRAARNSASVKICLQN